MMRVPAVIAVACVVVGGGFAAGLGAQSAPTQTFRAGVDLVQLDVSVLDKDRRPVHGLTAADFTVFEDGRPQPVVTFQPFDIPDRVIPKTGWLREVAPDVATNRLLNGRLVVIVINDAMMAADYWTTATAGRVADKILDQLGPEDLASVVYMKGNGKAQAFTSDRALIRAAFSDIKSVMPAPLNSKWVCGGSIDELVRVAESLRLQPERRKTILFVSPGFEFRDPETFSVSSCVRDFLRDAQQWNINVYGVDPGRMLMNWTYARMANAHASANSAFNARHDNLDGLTTLAETTGGRAVLNTKDDNPEEEVPAIFEENSSYYLLGFQSDNAKDAGRFRKLEVKVNRPGVTVRTRSGYYPGPAGGLKPSKKDSAPKSPLEASVTDVLPMSGTDLRMAAAPFAIPGSNKSAVAIVLGVRATIGQAAEHVSVLSGAFDLEGKSQAIARQTFDVTAASSEADRQYEVLSRLDLAPGRYEVRLGTENARGQRGSVFTSVEVPDFSKAPLSLSGLVLDRSPSMAVTPTALLASVLPVVPTAERTFTVADHVGAFVRVYEPKGARPLTMSVVLVDGEDREVFRKNSQLAAGAFGTAHAADYRIDLPLATLKSGPHLLTIEANAGAKLTAARQVRFDVR